LEADALEMSLRNEPLTGTVNRAVQSIAGYAENKGISIAVEESDKNLVLPHDSHWLTEAIANLLKNAVEHSPPGGTVAIGWDITPAFVRMHVKDQGRGIDPEQLPHIFKKFYRSSSEGSGVGLGLPLAKSIVEKHGGLLSAAANPAGGTIFYLSLPHHPLPENSPKLTKL
jgi:signal transduction histidine kinase